MKIKNIFEKDINRYINGVITVGNNDEKAVQQEIEEYVVTQELKPHFSKFFDKFAASLEHPNSEIGVWISGFFGSGKSHFLKMLSYLLENKVVGGKPTIEYFRNKFDDPLEFYGIEKCCSKGDNKTILFNIADYTQDKQTGIRDVFSQVFYNSIGYFGTDPRVVEFEKWLDDSGKKEDFVRCYRDASGKDWLSDRGMFIYRKKAIVSAIVAAGIATEEEANGIFMANPSKIFSINSLTDDIAAYVKKRPDNFRLVFMVDEIGFYIGENSSLMLELQTLVEQLGDKCGGKVWIVVTGQEAIDSLVHVKGDQFNKIMDRFATKLHLTASSVEEVIRKRLLAKNETGKDCLTVLYEQKGASLKNTFTFEQAVSSLKGYRDTDEFVADYPFVSYQYHLLQDTLEGIRLHKQSTFTLSGGSRNMLGSFKAGITSGLISYVGEDDQLIQNGDVGTNGDGALFPFYRFYDAIREDLISTVRLIFSHAEEQAEKNEGLKEEDVNVLKLLYLVRYVDNDLKATLTNIAILMTESIDEDQIALRKRVGESLERLHSQNYVAKNGDVWMFLTDEERDVDVEIQQQNIDSDEVSREIGNVIFSEIYPLKKAKYGVYDFDFDRYVDDLAIGTQTGGMKLSIVSPNNDFGKDNETGILLRSGGDRSIIAVLSSEHPFYDKLLEILKVEKYQKTKNQSSLQAGVKAAISARITQAKLDRTDVEINIEKSLKDATFYVDGVKQQVKGAAAKDKVSEALSSLVEAVYTELGQVTYNVKDPSEIKSILSREEGGLIEGGQVINQEAVDDLDKILGLKYQSHSTMTVADIYKRYRDKPYGFRDYDIAAMIAELLAAQKVVLSYNGIEYKKSDPMVIDLLSKKSYIDSVVVKQRIVVDPSLLAKCINIMKDFTGDMDVPSKEDDFVDYVVNTFEKKAQECENFLSDFYSHGHYPQQDEIKKAKSIYRDILLYKANETKLLERIRDQEKDLLDAKDDSEDVVSFFNGKQKGIFDNASRRFQFFSDDLQYISANPEAVEAYNSIKSILTMEKPFQKIAELPNLVSVLENKHAELLNNEKNAAYELINKYRDELGTYVQDFSKDIYSHYSNELTNQRSFVDHAEKIIAVVAQESTIRGIKEEGANKLLNAKAPNQPTVEGTSGEAEVPVASKPKEPVQMAKNSVIESATLTTKSDVDNYVEKLKAKLYAFLKDGGVKID
jgi:hypothetical protein